MKERIRTLHPDPDWSGVIIDKERYDIVVKAIMEILDEQKTISFKDRTIALGGKLEGNFDGSIGWYTTTIKLDLEARGLIERIPGRRPQMIQLIRKKDEIHD